MGHGEYYIKNDAVLVKGLNAPLFFTALSFVCVSRALADYSPFSALACKLVVTAVSLLSEHSSKSSVDVLLLLFEIAKCFFLKNSLWIGY